METEMETETHLPQSHRLISIGILLFLIFDLSTFLMYQFGISDLIISNVYYYGNKLSLILIIASLNKNFITIFVVTFLSLTFTIYLMDEIFDCLIKSTWSIYILIISSIISLCYHYKLFRKLQHKLHR